MIGTKDWKFSNSVEIIEERKSNNGDCPIYEIP